MLISCRKKVYMVYNVEPHKDLMGEMWYSGEDGEVDQDFIKQVRELALQCIVTKVRRRYFLITWIGMGHNG